MSAVVHLAAAAVHAIRQTPMPLLMESMDVGRSRERLAADTERQLAAAERDLRTWIAEGAQILEAIRAECRKAAEAGVAVDLSPAIDVIEERIAKNTRLMQQARKKFDRLGTQARAVSPSDAALVRQVARRAVDFLAREIDALSDQGLAYRALQHAFGDADQGRVHHVEDAGALARLFDQAER